MPIRYAAKLRSSTISLTELKTGFKFDEHYEIGGSPEGETTNRQQLAIGLCGFNASVLGLRYNLIIIRISN